MTNHDHIVELCKAVIQANAEKDPDLQTYCPRIAGGLLVLHMPASHSRSGQPRRTRRWLQFLRRDGRVMEIPTELITQAMNVMTNRHDPDFTPWDFQCTLNYLASEYGMHAVNEAFGGSAVNWFNERQL